MFQLRLWVIAVLAVLPIAAWAERPSLEERVLALEQALARRPLDLSAYELPKTLTFCGQTIDQSGLDVRERLEREFYMALGDRAQVILWAKRARRVFPVIEEHARRLNTCSDLKYLAVVESGLRAGVTSHANAHGYWQFLAPTAKQYGLKVSDHWDQRADLSAASAAGLSYLRDLNRQFKDWPLALAAYNTGPGRLSRAMADQGLSDFWSLDLYEEAERYVPRILAIKAIMSDLEGYGFAFTVEEGWAPEALGFVKVQLPSGLSVAAAAKGAGIPVREFRRLNPELGREQLPSGQEVVLEVPRGKERALKDWLEAHRGRGKVKVEPEPAPVVAASSPEDQPRDEPDEPKLAEPKLDDEPDAPAPKKKTPPKAKKAPESKADLPEPDDEDAPKAKKLDEPKKKLDEPKKAEKKPADEPKKAEKKPADEPKKAEKKPADEPKKDEKKSGKTKRYTIKAGDSLWTISQTHGVSVVELRAWNKLGPKDALMPGQQILVSKP